MQCWKFKEGLNLLQTHTSTGEESETPLRGSLSQLHVARPAWEHVRTIDCKILKYVSWSITDFIITKYGLVAVRVCSEYSEQQLTMAVNVSIFPG